LIAALRRFFALPPAEQSRTVEAALYLLAVRVVFGLKPLPRALWLFGIVQGQAGAGRVAVLEAEAVSRAIARAAHNVPFRAVCLQQAFAALLMLRRRGLTATVHLGLAREGMNDLKAHAWSHCGEVPVTGVAAAHGFVAVAAFAA
jgi:Transglutaminase-like superfamily